MWAWLNANYLPGWGSETCWRKWQNPDENWGRLNNPDAFTASRSSCHLSPMRWWLNWKNDSLNSELPDRSQLSATTFNILAARSCESLDTPIVLSSINLIIFLNTSASFTKAHLKKRGFRTNKIILVVWKSKWEPVGGYWTYPMRVPAWPVAFETVNNVKSLFVGEEMGVYWGQ